MKIRCDHWRYCRDKRCPHREAHEPAVSGYDCTKVEECLVLHKQVRCTLDSGGDV